MEVVFIAPLIILFILVLVGFGQLVAGRSAVDGAARDAARAGSLERDSAAAKQQAEAVATEQLKDICRGGITVEPEQSSHQPGTLYTVTVSCDVKALDLLGLPLTDRLSGTSTAPIDFYRRSGN
ncbi:TadE/TadG family type IV pilus assembly protein [Streptomyces sp. YIM 98790]|uniref:TadE/TadG family type IV pilus assembly protein n=1 Tax=Streptomyces sp. YIM 98790 TaxID=2689077 RepID=UPI0028BD42B6|nr:TadE/TadG family type IV pilus assembly protein [Streptomyces sp. YIM 98790]